MSIMANFPGFVIDFVFVMCYNSVTLRAESEKFRFA